MPTYEVGLFTVTRCINRFSFVTLVIFKWIQSQIDELHSRRHNPFDTPVQSCLHPEQPRCNIRSALDENTRLEDGNVWWWNSEYAIDRSFYSFKHNQSTSERNMSSAQNKNFQRQSMCLNSVLLVPFWIKFTQGFLNHNVKFKGYKPVTSHACIAFNLIANLGLGSKTPLDTIKEQNISDCNMHRHITVHCVRSTSQILGQQNLGQPPGDLLCKITTVEKCVRELFIWWFQRI